MRVAMPPGLRTFENLQFELSEPPEGVTLAEVSVSSDRAEFIVVADPEKAKSGQRGSLIVVVSGKREPPSDKQGRATRQRVSLGALPAIMFEIVRSPLL